MTQADAYFELALQVIKFAQFPSGLRSWWESERVHRRDYDLSDEQIDGLIQACKDHVAFLEGEIIPERKPPPKQHNRYGLPRSRRGRPAI